MQVNVTVESKISNSPRVKQLSAMFDVPAQEKTRLTWEGDFPFEAQDWNLGLIVGPSGVGKTTISTNLFGVCPPLVWKAASVIDDFDRKLSIEEIASVCQSVGFNTIPAWMRPYSVLSTGEKFRVEIARRMLELSDPIVVDEFTSVVDRQVAQIGSHAVQKYVRKNLRKFVAISCHYDVIDWLQPDWIFEPATMHFARRSLQRRPELGIEIARVPYSTWRYFAPFHYLTADLSTSARCFGLFVNDRLACFAGVMHRPHPKVSDVQGVSRLVTLPDWQGIGLAMVLVDKLGAAFRALKKRLHTYPAHPSLIRSFDHSRNWRLEKRPGKFSSKSMGDKKLQAFGSRPCAVFSYQGEAMDYQQAKGLIESRV
jgi:ABC-type lipoprotein export system ATPase subunit